MIVALTNDNKGCFWIEPARQIKTRQSNVQAHSCKAPNLILLLFWTFSTLFFFSQHHCTSARERERWRRRRWGVRMWARVISTRDLACGAHTTAHRVTQAYQCTWDINTHSQTHTDQTGYFTLSLYAVSFSTCRVFVAGDNGCEIREPTSAWCSGILSSETVCLAGLH